MDKLAVLVATMFNTNIEGLVREMNLQSDSIVVNQCDCEVETVCEKEIDGQCVTIINSPKRGLSVSRNTALDYAQNRYDLVVFTDDDIRFQDNYVEEIMTAYKDTAKDLIVFNVRRANGSLNKKLGNTINQITLFRVCSVSLTARMDKIKNIRFDESFGTGSKVYTLGEENIFVSDCLHAGLQVYTNDYIMCQICENRPSTWFQGINERFMFSKGASFRRMHKNMYWFFIVDFALRKYKFYRKQLSFVNAFKALVAGSVDYGRSC